VLLAIAARASEVVLAVYGTAFDVEYKGPSESGTTVADRLANELICNELAREFPGCPDRGRGEAPRTSPITAASSGSSSSIRSTARASSCSETASSW
jgi:hypothetical protein